MASKPKIVYPNGIFTFADMETANPQLSAVTLRLVMNQNPNCHQVKGRAATDAKGRKAGFWLVSGQ